MNLNEPPGRSDITRETNFLKPEISKVSIGHFWGEFPDPITTKFRGDQPDRSLLKKKRPGSRRSDRPGSPPKNTMVL